MSELYTFSPEEWEQAHVERGYSPTWHTFITFYPDGVTVQHLRYGSTTTTLTTLERRGKPRTPPERPKTQAEQLNPLWQLDQQLRHLGGTDDDAV